MLHEPLSARDDAAARYVRATVPRNLRDKDPYNLQRLNELVYALRVEDGLSYPAVAAVLRRYEGCTVTPEQVRKWLYRLGAPQNPKKARPRYQPCPVSPKSPSIRAPL